MKELDKQNEAAPGRILAKRKSSPVKVRTPAQVMFALPPDEAKMSLRIDIDLSPKIISRTNHV